MEFPTATALSDGVPLITRATTFHRYGVLASRSTGTVKMVSVIPGKVRATFVAVSVIVSA